MNNTLYSRYIQFGFKALRCRGYNPKYNPQRDYKTAKEPIDKGFTDSTFKGLPIQDMEEWEKTGGWIGWLIPKGYIVLDVEDPESISYIRTLCENKGINPPEHNSNRGKHFIFKTDKDLPGDSGIFTKCGLKVTYRMGGKNCLILAPTNERTWEVEL